MSLRDRALAKPSRKTRTVTTAEWGDVTVRELDGAQRLAFLATVDPNDPRADMGVLLDYMTDLILDPETGKEAFEIADLDQLKRDHGGVLTRLLLNIIDLSELGEVDLEEAEGNSAATPN